MFSRKWIFFCIVLPMLGCQLEKKSIDKAKVESIDSQIAHNNEPLKKAITYQGENIEIGLGRLLANAQQLKMLGRQLNEQDKKIIGQVAYKTLEFSLDKKETHWHNQATHHQGIFKVLATHGKSADNLVCRDFVHILQIGDNREEIYGQACRDMWAPKGQWILQG